MTSAKVKLALGQPQHARLKYLDIVSGSFGIQLRAKGAFEGVDAVAYLPGDVEDGLSALKAAGVVRDIPLARPDDLHPAVEVRLLVHDVVLEAEKPDPKAATRLKVAKNGAPAVAAAAMPANGAAVTPGAAALPVVSASESLEAKRAAIVATFGAAIDAVIAEYAPRFAAQRIALSDDVIYRCAFTLFAAWRDAGCA